MHNLLILSNNLIFDSVLGLMTTNYYKAKSRENDVENNGSGCFLLSQPVGRFSVRSANGTFDL